MPNLRKRSGLHSLITISLFRSGIRVSAHSALPYRTVSKPPLPFGADSPLLRCLVGGQMALTWCLLTNQTERVSRDDRHVMTTNEAAIKRSLQFDTDSPESTPLVLSESWTTKCYSQPDLQPSDAIPRILYHLLWRFRARSEYTHSFKHRHCCAPCRPAGRPYLRLNQAASLAVLSLHVCYTPCRATVIVNSVMPSYASWLILALACQPHHVAKAMIYLCHFAVLRELHPLACTISRHGRTRQTHKSPGCCCLYRLSS
ncbi:hypothetical protein K402DRAFT_250151 [Aulographum hederae CBS 113979]|uniref:Uncharacterized protein n=1 Tax=Aulographum hederae CBS 113979 TaxID=1176131 RepID=A0A6G1GK84_9PEZI|nr:hypothetical protein K402DRAFT_250151 [Aulographum hederae CBS 113979]